MKKRLILIIAAVVCMASATYAQGLRSLCINEVMVINDSSAVDDFGEHSAWIELFNKNFAPLQISSIFITTDRTNIDNPSKEKMYAVPLGDVRTKLAKRQHVIFWADGKHERGTFHTNFTLNKNDENWIGIYAADGKTLIDSVRVPANLAANQSYARTTDGGETWSIRHGSRDENKLDYVTPASTNVITPTNPKVDKFAENDASGFQMTILAMGIVFLALFVLSLCFLGIGEIGKYFSRRNKARATGVTLADVDPKSHDSGEEIAAIVMALHEHLNAHDTESTVLTINKVKRAYSPWSSKIYSMRELPHK